MRFAMELFTFVVLRVVLTLRGPEVGGVAVLAAVKVAVSSRTE